MAETEERQWARLGDVQTLAPRILIPRNTILEVTGMKEELGRERSWEGFTYWRHGLVWRKPKFEAIWIEGNLV